MAANVESPQDIACERALFRRLLDLGHADEVETAIAHTLGLVCALTRAKAGHIQLCNRYAVSAPVWSISHGLDGVGAAEIVAKTASDVIGRCMSSGETLLTPFAFEGPGLGDCDCDCDCDCESQSVEQCESRAVLCAPVGRAPAFGVIYLQGRLEPGGFTALDRERLELCARQLASLTDRLMSQAAAGCDRMASMRSRFKIDDVVGRSAPLAAAIEQLGLAAPLDVSVMIYGGTGTGKSHLARVLHRNSRRASGPFVELNCAALPETLLESELFGSAKGAHSTATARTIGKVAAAEGGTLFLDEVGELSLTAQAKLLHLLQSSTYYPLGSASLERADVRIVAATHQDLKALIAARQFREDLYYRLQVLPVCAPALDERREDIDPLADWQLAQVCRRHGLAQLELSPAARYLLETSPWPGNVRQLFHVIEAGAIRAAGAGMSRVEAKHLFPDGQSEAQEDHTFHHATRRFQRDLVQRTLEQTQWNIKDAAVKLDVARSYLYKLIQAFGLERDPAAASAAPGGDSVEPPPVSSPGDTRS